MAKCLSFHAAYRCRRSGACCSAGWNIPFDAAEIRVVSALKVASGSINPAGDRASAVLTDGRCSFLAQDADGAHVCEIHRAGGHGALPLTCRMFPRIVLHDSRGTFISLSHFCPTAAALLFEHDEDDVTIVDASPGLAGSDPLDGLDARDVWPPLLRPGVMMDLDSYDLWERFAIAILTHDGVPARRALDALDHATERITAWTSAAGVSLEASIRDAIAGVAVTPSPLASFESGVKRWLAARAFGSWIAYQGNGLRTIVRYLRSCHHTFEVELARDNKPLEAIRRADHLIVHESSSQRLANLLNVGP